MKERKIMASSNRKRQEELSVEQFEWEREHFQPSFLKKFELAARRRGRTSGAGSEVYYHGIAVALEALVQRVHQREGFICMPDALVHLNEETQSIDVRKAKMWDMCVNAARRGEGIPRGVFFIDIREPTAEEIEHGKVLESLISEEGERDKLGDRATGITG